MWDLAEGKGRDDVTTCSYAKCAFKFAVRNINIVMPKLLKLAHESYIMQLRVSTFKISPSNSGVLHDIYCKEPLESSSHLFQTFRTFC
jgi:hypothetical protein